MAERSYSKPSPDELRSRLGSLEYEVTQHDATEPPFRNRFWDNHEAGLYVDIASGEPLFSSTDKFDSGTGWPSFWKPVDPENVVDHADLSHGYRRVEVRSKHGDSHLGHVFEDGPRPTGLRYCINSASLRFIPVAQLEAEGYGAYRALFGDGKATHQEVVDHDNACAVPAPGEAPSCEATVEEAILAGGCFWGMEDILGKIPGVIESEVGYAGGSTAKPTYEQVRTGKTGHAESIRILFDPKRISFEDLLDQWFFKMHDPTTKNQQGNDRGSQYRSAIFVTSPAQREAAVRAVRKAQESGRWRGRPVVTEIVDAGTFTSAEDYHQKYLDKHPGGYTCHFMRD